MEDDFECFIKEIDNILIQLSKSIKTNIKNKQDIKNILNYLKISKIEDINKLLDFIKEINNISIFVIYLDLYKNINISYRRKTIIKELDIILISLYKIIYIHVTQNIDIDTIIKKSLNLKYIKN